MCCLLIYPSNRLYLWWSLSCQSKKGHWGTFWLIVKPRRLGILLIYGRRVIGGPWSSYKGTSGKFGMLMLPCWILSWTSWPTTKDVGQWSLWWRTWRDGPGWALTRRGEIGSFQTSGNRSLMLLNQSLQHWIDGGCIPTNRRLGVHFGNSYGLVGAAKSKTDHLADHASCLLYQSLGCKMEGDTWHLSYL